jgi:hypothetical protein
MVDRYDVRKAHGLDYWGVYQQAPDLNGGEAICFCNEWEHASLIMEALNTVEQLKTEKIDALDPQGRNRTYEESILAATRPDVGARR